MLGYTSRSTINKIELGYRDITQSKVCEFAKALQTTPAYLMGWETDTEEAKNPTFTGEEQQLVDLYNKCTQEGKAIVMRTAENEAVRAEREEK